MKLFRISIYFSDDRGHRHKAVAVPMEIVRAMVDTMSNNNQNFINN